MSIITKESRVAENEIASIVPTAYGELTYDIQFKILRSNQVNLWIHGHSACIGLQIGIRGLFAIFLDEASIGHVLIWHKG